MTARLWWLWVVEEMVRAGIWAFDAVSGAGGTLVDEFDQLTDRPR